jgi:hypothetical protein
VKALIVTFDFRGTGADALYEWRRFVGDESVPRFERQYGLRHKLFLWRDDPPEAVTVYLFADDEECERYIRPHLDGTGEFRTTRIFGAPAHIEVLDVAGIADGPQAPGRR